MEMEVAEKANANPQSSNGEINHHYLSRKLRLRVLPFSLLDSQLVATWKLLISHQFLRYLPEKR